MFISGNATELNTLYRLQKYMGKTEKKCYNKKLYIQTSITSPYSGIFVLTNLLQKLKEFKNASLGLY